LDRNSFDNKENVPPLQRKITTDKGVPKAKLRQAWRASSEDQGMVIRNCDGSLAACYVMKDPLLKIGRSALNTIRSLEVSVQEEHAEVIKALGKHYLQDKGTEAGTFIKISHPRPLRVGTLIEMGSFLMEVLSIERSSSCLCLRITHMIS
jgi:F0F1-type ATP synthase alpha subunit